MTRIEQMAAALVLHHQRWRLRETAENWSAVEHKLEQLTQLLVDQQLRKTERPLGVLAEADKLTNGARRKDYGHPIDDFTRTGRMWGAILDLPQAVTPEQIALCMTAVKMSRQCHTPKRDNIVDGAGYLNTLQMVIEERERRALEETQEIV